MSARLSRDGKTVGIIVKFLTIALAMLLATASVARMIIIDGDTIDVDGTHIRIGPRLRPSGRAVT